MKFTIAVEEVISRAVIVEASSISEALAKVEKAVDDGRFVLDGMEDYLETNVFDLFYDESHDELYERFEDCVLKNL